MTKNNKPANEGLLTAVCPHTGVITYTRPEWTNVIFGASYSLSLTVIGDRIIFVKIKGQSTLDVVADSTEFTKKIIRTYFNKHRELFYIGDFTGITGITKEARSYYLNYLNNLKQLHTFVLCSPSPIMMLAANLTKRFNIIRFRVIVEKNYPDAVKQAVWCAYATPAAHKGAHPPRPGPAGPVPVPADQRIRQVLHANFPFLAKSKNTREPEALTRFTRNEWQRTFDGYSVRFELINDNIIHRISKGYLNADYVQPVYDLQERILKSCGLEGHPYHLVNGIEELQGSSLKSRKQHARHFAQWMEKYPELGQLIVYRANRLMRAGLSIPMYTSPVSILFVDTFDEAMALVQCAQESSPLPRCRFFDRRARHKITVQHHADELNRFLANINWEVEGSGKLVEKKSEGHPFKSVYDAIALIKVDIDELFHDREMAQVALRESEEVARALLNATSDLALLIQSGGTVISVNHALAEFLGRDPDSLKGARAADLFPQPVVAQARPHLKRVLATGKPALFETRTGNLYYHNTIFPVFSAEKEVDRLALYSRDITTLKEAQEQIHGLTQQLIKAQENERRRIARDLHDNVAQDLASLIIKSDALFDDCRGLPPEFSQRTRKFSEILKKTIASIRDLVYDLRPPGLTEIGLVKTIDQYCIEFSNKTGIETDLYTAGLERLHLGTDTKINIFRILQEALNNAAKHAGASLIKVRLLSSHPELILRIEDNGRGFDPDERMLCALKEKRMGIKSMEERVNLLSGTLALCSRKGRGTRIVVRFPYKQNPQEDAAEQQESRKATPQ